MSNRDRVLKAQENCLNAVRKVQNYDIAKLDRRNDLGSQLAFDELIVVAGKFVGLFQRIDLDQIEALSLKQSNNLATACNSMLQKFKEAEELSIDQGVNITDVRMNIIIDSESYYESVVDAFHGLIAFLSIDPQAIRVKLTTADNLLNSLNQKSTEITERVESQAESNQDRYTSLINSAETMTEDLRKLVGIGGVSTQAGYYHTEAAANEEVAAKWLRASVLSGLIIVALSFVILTKPDLISVTPTSTYETIQLAVGKALVFGALTSLLVFFTKNYNASKHNATVNRHRANALKTYETIVNAASASDNRDIILAHAAQCIFSDQPSGYNKSDHSESSMPVVSFASPVIKPNND